MKGILALFLGVVLGNGGGNASSDKLIKVSVNTTDTEPPVPCLRAEFKAKVNKKLTNFWWFTIVI